MLLDIIVMKYSVIFAIALFIAAQAAMAEKPAANCPSSDLSQIHEALENFASKPTADPGNTFEIIKTTDASGCPSFTYKEQLLLKACPRIESGEYVDMLMNARRGGAKKYCDCTENSDEDLCVKQGYSGLLLKYGPPSSHEPWNR